MMESENHDLPSMKVTVLDSTSKCQFLLHNANLLPQVDGPSELPQNHLIYPKDMIHQYTDVAISEIFHKGKIECLAYVAGYKQDNTLIGTHLIFPRQVGTASTVEDLGNYNI